MVIRDDGELVWVLDAYTVSNKYPYLSGILFYDRIDPKDPYQKPANSVAI